MSVLYKFYIACDFVALDKPTFNLSLACDAFLSITRSNLSLIVGF